MAFVGISDTLVSEVRGNIRTMYQKEAASLGDRPAINLIGDESFIAEALNELWNDAPHLQAQMPKDWCRAWDSIRLHLTVTDANLQKSLDVKLPVTFHGPPKHTAVPVANVTGTSVEDIPEILFDYVRHEINLRDVADRWNKVEKDISNFLRECKSLNEALKLWPDLRVYIPQHFLTRVDTKPERNKTVSAAASALQNIDTSAAMSAAVIARMA